MLVTIHSVKFMQILNGIHAQKSNLACSHDKVWICVEMRHSNQGGDKS